jgi:hypothetical protein
MSLKYSQNENDRGKTDSKNTFPESGIPNARKLRKDGIVYKTVRNTIYKILQQANVIDDVEQAKDYLNTTQLGNWTTEENVRKTLSEMAAKRIISDFDVELMRGIAAAAGGVDYRDAIFKEVAVLNRRGLDDKEIGTQVGLTRPAAMRIRVDLGLPPNKKFYRKLRDYGNKTKAEIRRRKYVFNDSHMRGDPEDALVLALTGHNVYDLEQIYDRQKIPRKNIQAVENREAAYKRFRGHKTGAKMELADISDFLLKTTKVYREIDLDFEGHAQEKYLEALGIIFERDLLENNGIISITYSISREHEDAKRFIRHAGIHELVGEIAQLKGKRKNKEANDLMKRFAERPYKVLREYVDELFAEEALNARLIATRRDSPRKISNAYAVKDVERLSYVGRHAAMHTVNFQFEKTKGSDEDALRVILKGIEKVKRAPIEEVKLPDEIMKQKVDGSPRALNDEEKQQIRQDVKMTPREQWPQLAKKYNVSLQQISAFRAHYTMRSRSH